jgi:hypothetical protein
MTSGRKGDSDPAKVQYETIEVNVPVDASYFAFPVTASN